MGKSKIEWTDRVWNPVTGCTKVSDGCKNCYAERVFHRPYPGRAFSYVRLHSERLEAPLHWRKPQRIFVCSMGDLFHEAVPDEFVELIFAVMALCRQHTFQVLTKRPERMSRWTRGVGGVMRRDFVNSKFHYMMEKMDDFPRGIGFPRTAPDWPFPNVWLGVSVEDQQTAEERIPILLQIDAAVRFVSIEPILGPVILQTEKSRGYLQEAGCRCIHWVICGGESGPNARPMHPDWARSLRDQCQAAGVPFFFKQWGEWVPAEPHTPQFQFPHYHNWPDGTVSIRVGKKCAGRFLDGREWNEFPKSSSNG